MTKTDALLADLRSQIKRLTSDTGYLNAGAPNYEHLFGRDSSISALQLLHEDPTIAKATLRTLAKYQGTKRRLMREEYPGKILHEHFPGGFSQMWHDFWADNDKLRKLAVYLTWRFPYYGSVDAGAWFIILLHHYYDETHDAELVNELWPNVLGVRHWLKAQAQHPKSDLVGFKRHYLFGLRNQSWKDNLNVAITPPTAMIEVQGYYYYAYNCAANLAARVVFDSVSAADFSKSATKLKQAFHASFVMDDSGYPLALDGNLKPVAIATSNPGHLLFTGILNKTEADQVVERLMRSDMLTPYGIRTEATSSPRFKADDYHEGSVWPFDNWVIYQGMLKTGHAAEAAVIKEAILAAQRKLTIVPELYAVDPATQTLSTIPSSCTIQAWSAGALINILTQSDATL